jgi:hypothetical protein
MKEKYREIRRKRPEKNILDRSQARLVRQDEAEAHGQSGDST